MDAYVFRAFAEAVEVVPYTLAENAGLNPIQIVTELRNLHATVRQLKGNGRWGWEMGYGIPVCALRACPVWL